MARALHAVGRVPARAGGSSMSPFLRAGTYWIERCGPAALTAGDVVAYRDRGVLVLHRVIHAEGDRLVVRGDAQDDATSVEASALVGRLCGLAIGRHQWRDAPRALSRRWGRAIVRLAPWVQLTRRGLARARAWARPK